MKKKGRPRVDSEAILVRMLRGDLVRIDQWIEGQQEPALRRPEAIRRLCRIALRKRAPVIKLDERRPARPVKLAVVRRRP